MISCTCRPSRIKCDPADCFAGIVDLLRDFGLWPKSLNISVVIIVTNVGLLQSNKMQTILLAIWEEASTLVW